MADDYVFRPGDGTNILLRKILERLNAGLVLYGVGELPTDVEIVAVANFPADQLIHGSVGVTNFPASQNVVVTNPVAVSNFPASTQVSNFPVSQHVYGGPVDIHVTDPSTNKQAHVSHFRQLHTESQTRLVGQPFNTGSTLDTNFWTSSPTGSGTATVSQGLLRLQTGTTANSVSRVSSVRVARHIGNTVNIFRTVVRGDAGVANNTRRWGIFDDNNGFFFQISGTTFSIGRRYGGADTLVNAGAWNVVNTFAWDINWHSYEVHFSVTKAYFYIDDVLVHVADMLGSVVVLLANQNLPVRWEDFNSNGGTTNVNLYSTHGLVSRLGTLHTNNKFANIATNTTSVLKYAAGSLDRILVGNPAGTVTIYDNTSAAGTILTTIDMTGLAVAAVLELDVSFNVGLTVVTSSASVNITVIYE